MVSQGSNFPCVVNLSQFKLQLILRLELTLFGLGCRGYRGVGTPVFLEFLSPHNCWSSFGVFLGTGVPPGNGSSPQFVSRWV